MAASSRDGVTCVRLRTVGYSSYYKAVTETQTFSVNMSDDALLGLTLQIIRKSLESYTGKRPWGPGPLQ